MNRLYTDLQMVHQKYKQKKNTTDLNYVVDFLEIIWISSRVIRDYKKTTTEITDETLAALVAQFLARPSFSCIQEVIQPVIDHLKDVKKGAFITEVAEEFSKDVGKTTKKKVEEILDLHDIKYYDARRVYSTSAAGEQNATTKPFRKILETIQNDNGSISYVLELNSGGRVTVGVDQL